MVTFNTDKNKLWGEIGMRGVWLSSWNYTYEMHKICSLYVNKHFKKE